MMSDFLFALLFFGIASGVWYLVSGVYALAEKAAALARHLKLDLCLEI